MRPEGLGTNSRRLGEQGARRLWPVVVEGRTVQDDGRKLRTLPDVRA